MSQLHCRKHAAFLAGIALFAAVALGACANASSVSPSDAQTARTDQQPSFGNATAPGVVQPSTPRQNDARTPLLLTPQSVIDPQAGGITAMTWLAPAGWNSSASVVWLPAWERVAHLQTTITDTASGLTIDWLPIQDFIYFEPPAGFQVPIGGNYQGKAYVPPIADPARFVNEFWVAQGALPQLQGAALVTEVEIPQIAQEFLKAFGGPGEAHSWHLRYAYDHGGQPWEQDVDFSLLYSAANGITSWYVNFATTASAPAGVLDNLAGVISTTIASRNSTPEWEGTYRLVQRLFVQGIQQQMADTAAFGRLLAQHRQESQALQQQVTAERAASQDRIADLRGQVLLGVQNYVNPFSTEIVQLPQGWSVYWTNQQGQYLATDPGVDPNTIGNGGWQQLAPRGG